MEFFILYIPSACSRTWLAVFHRPDAKGGESYPKLPVSACRPWLQTRVIEADVRAEAGDKTEHEASAIHEASSKTCCSREMSMSRSPGLQMAATMAVYRGKDDLLFFLSWVEKSQCPKSHSKPLFLYSSYNSRKQRSNRRDLTGGHWL